MSRKEFRKHNSAFACMACGHENPPRAHGERNHCRRCLRSKHVDEATPGDRRSPCGGVMDPVKLEYRGAKGFMIVHRCTVCGKQQANSAAEDDEHIERLEGMM